MSPLLFNMHHQSLVTLSTSCRYLFLLQGLHFNRPLYWGHTHTHRRPVVKYVIRHALSVCLLSLFGLRPRIITATSMFVLHSFLLPVAQLFKDKCKQSDSAQSQAINPKHSPACFFFLQNRAVTVSSDLHYWYRNYSCICPAESGKVYKICPSHPFKKAYLTPKIMWYCPNTSWWKPVKVWTL